MMQDLHTYGFTSKNHRIMKKTLLLLVLGLASLSLSAQSRISYSLEFGAGVGVGKGPQFSFTPAFVAHYD